MYQFRKVSDRVARLRERYRNTPYTLDTERALILTASYKKNKHLHPALRRAYGIYDICAQKTIRVEDDELIV